MTNLEHASCCLDSLDAISTDLRLALTTPESCKALSCLSLLKQRIEELEQFIPTITGK